MCTLGHLTENNIKILAGKYAEVRVPLAAFLPLWARVRRTRTELSANFTGAAMVTGVALPVAHQHIQMHTRTGCNNDCITGTCPHRSLDADK